MTERKLLIFGNGLGMALAPDFFTLDSGIERVWTGGVLSDSQKLLINSCVGCEPDERPRKEGDLDRLQRALVACEFLAEVRPSEVTFLTQDGQDFPRAIRVFVREVAYSFHTSCPKALPSSFITPLVQFLAESRSHVATLNYDRLLYDPFIENHILADYEGVLVDGFWDTTGFKAENLARKYGRSFGSPPRCVAPTVS